MSEWQPIETAPMDERVVMGYFGPGHDRYGFAAISHFFKWEAMPKRLPTNWPITEAPTHWMPLPEPPK